MAIFDRVLLSICDSFPVTWSIMTYKLLVFSWTSENLEQFVNWWICRLLAENWQYFVLSAR